MTNRLNLPKPFDFPVTIWMVGYHDGYFHIAPGTFPENTPTSQLNEYLTGYGEGMNDSNANQLGRNLRNILKGA